MKYRLDKLLVERGLAPTRSQAAHLIALGEVRVAGQLTTKSGAMVDDSDKIAITSKERYVSRAGLKLASVAATLKLDFQDTVVLDVGSSTGGFTDYALKHGAQKVIAVDVGTDQLHPSLRNNPKIELHEKTNILDCHLRDSKKRPQAVCLISQVPQIVVIDVSFVSLRQILPHILNLSSETTKVIAMVKPQFEANRRQLTKTGIVKNDRLRRDILADFEQWAKQHFIIVNKSDSEVAGTHGNRERFYHLEALRK